MPKIVIIANNLRSTHNIGSLFRTADGLGINKIYLTGYTPYPMVLNDQRLPHISKKIDLAIAKTALGAHKTVPFEHHDNITTLIKQLKLDNYKIIALEQTKNSLNIINYQPPKKIALLIGREVEGIEPELLELADDIIVIPMLGKKESFNVVQATAIALYHLKYAPF